ncbi:MAG: anaerobic ribonucleoside-triphosphate reductase activating protein [Lachnospirales bacterium]
MRYHDITKCDMKNGDGLRTVLWVAGCSHRCPGCHNPITWDPNDGIPFDQAAKEEIFEELSRDYISGITLSGGDPLFPGNRDTVAELIYEIKEKFPEKTIWLYTGYLWEDVKDLPGISQVDVLVDGPYVEVLRDTTLHWKGSSNQRVIDVPSTLRAGQVILWDE